MGDAEFEYLVEGSSIALKQKKLEIRSNLCYTDRCNNGEISTLQIIGETSWIKQQTMPSSKN